MSTDPLSVAETLVRDCLETLKQRHEYGLKYPDHMPIKAESAAILKLTSSLLEHLDADAKQMRAEKQ